MEKELEDSRLARRTCLPNSSFTKDADGRDVIVESCSEKEGVQDHWFQDTLDQDPNLAGRPRSLLLITNYGYHDAKNVTLVPLKRTVHGKDSGIGPVNLGLKAPRP